MEGNDYGRYVPAMLEQNPGADAHIETEGGKGDQGRPREVSLSLSLLLSSSNLLGR